MGFDVIADALIASDGFPSLYIGNAIGRVEMQLECMDPAKAKTQRVKMVFERFRNATGSEGKFPALDGMSWCEVSSVFWFGEGG